MPDVLYRPQGSGGSVWIIRVVLLLAIAAVGITFLWGRSAPPASTPIQLPVANGRIAENKKIEASSIRYVELQPGEVSPEHLRDASQIVGRVAAKEILDGKAFKESLLKPATPPTPAVELPKGFVAIDVEHDKLEGVIGSMRPGTAVSIFAVRPSDGALSLITRKAQIHASDGSGELTLQMPVEDAVRCVQAQRTGRIMVVQGEDVNTIPVQELSDPNRPVEIIRGTRRSIEIPGETPK